MTVDRDDELPAVLVVVDGQVRDLPPELLRRWLVEAAGEVERENGQQ